MLLVKMAMRAAVLRVSSRRMSSLAVAGQSATVQLNQEGLAELPKTLPIHKRGEDQLVREGAQVRAQCFRRRAIRRSGIARTLA